MTLSEKAAYLKGLMDGIKLDTEKDENRLLKAVVDLLQDMAPSVDDLEENAIADAGMPSYTRPILRERHAKFHTKKTRKTAPDEDDEPEQPTLF